MEPSGAPTPFQVYCHACRVTFAAGTKRCVHCGGRLSREDRPTAGSLRGALNRLPAEEAMVAEPFEEMELEDQSRARSRLPISPVTLLWIVLIVGSVAQRACQGG